ncbi:unnamed protein product [Rhizophagus irregularis]|nr:unnamed protein product [Rhizophagus irregularis]
MTLKKYNVIIYFIILLNLVVNVVIAQENEPSPTVSGEAKTIPSSTKGTENAVESCIKDTTCISANDTLKLCNGLIKTPDKYIEENVRSGVYKVEERSLAKCMCNQPYYDTLSKCLECFVNATGTEFKVSPEEEYKKQCEKVGVTFTQTMQISSGISPKYKWGLVGGIALVVLGLIGFATFKHYKKKKLTEKISAEGGGKLSTSNDKYPPPQSPSVHFRYQYGEYAPPADTPYYPPPPGGQDGQYPPPPPPPQQQHHGVQGGQGEQYPPPPQQHEGGQGGQSDSYYKGRF